MSEPRKCRRCGAEMPADAPEGLCPECLLKQVMKSDSGPAQGATTPHGAAFVAPTPDELAEHFPQLEILELLGQGGMGVVYKARQSGLDRMVALKILPPNTDPAFAERFTREARALAKLAHNGIVSVHDFGQHDGLYYFIMEFVDGVNLRHVLREGKLTPDAALKIVPQVCEALQYAHEEGVVHRDIKPENILMDKKGRVKIADFGLAKLLGQKQTNTGLTGSQQVMGTLHYMAPEQMERPLEVDHRADIYSLGVVFYEMLTGELPLGRFAPPSQKVQVDVRLDEVVLRSLAKEPERRYQKVSDVKTQVERITSSPAAQFSSQGDRLHRAAVVALPSTTAPTEHSSKEPSIPGNPCTEIRRWVDAPGLCLAMVGLLQIPGILLVKEFYYLPVNIIDRWAHLSTFLVNLFIILCGLSGCFVSIGGLRMRRIESYGFVLFSVFLAMIPLTPIWVLHFPIAVWALIVLCRPEVRVAFAYHDQEASTPTMASESSDVQMQVSRASASTSHEDVQRPQKNRSWNIARLQIVVCLLGLGISFIPSIYRTEAFWGLYGRSSSDVPGVTVIDISYGSPAASTGLRLGDEIVAVDDMTLKDIEQLGHVEAMMQPGTEVKLRVKRGQQELVIPMVGVQPEVGLVFYAEWQLVSGLSFLILCLAIFVTQPIERIRPWRAMLAILIGFAVVAAILGALKMWYHVWHRWPIGNGTWSYANRIAAGVAALGLVVLGVVDLRAVISSTSETQRPAQREVPRQTVFDQVWLFGDASEHSKKVRRQGLLIFATLCILLSAILAITSTSTLGVFPGLMYGSTAGIGLALYGISICVVLIAAVEIWFEWWKRDDPFLWKVLRTGLLLISTLCLLSFLGASSRSNSDGFTFHIGSPSPWFEFTFGKSSGGGFGILGLSWSWPILAVGWISFYAYRKSLQAGASSSSATGEPKEPL